MRLRELLRSADYADNTTTAQIAGPGRFDKSLPAVDLSKESTMRRQSDPDRNRHYNRRWSESVSTRDVREHLEHAAIARRIGDVAAADAAETAALLAVRTALATPVTAARGRA
jgi:hypothetical protein